MDSSSSGQPWNSGHLQEQVCGRECCGAVVGGAEELPVSAASCLAQHVWLLRYCKECAAHRTLAPWLLQVHGRQRDLGSEDELRFGVQQEVRLTIGCSKG